MQEENNKVKKSFLQNMKAELKKVIWPTGKQVLNNTVATIAFVLLISAILVVLNFVFNFGKSRLDRKIFGIEPSNKSAITAVSGDVSGENLPETVETENEGTIEQVEETTENGETTENTEATEETNAEESVVTE